MLPKSLPILRLFTLVLPLACSERTRDGDDGPSGRSGDGGAVASGGSAASAGNSANGGTAANAGVTASGGSSASAGTNANGGSAGRAGNTGNGGVSANGGGAGNAGTPSIGGGGTNGGEAGAGGSEVGAGSAGMAGDSGEDGPFVPDIPNTELDGVGEGLTLVGFTLIDGANGAALYAAVRNEGETPACEAGMQTYLYDRADQLVTTVGSVLLSGRLYRLDDGSGAILACVAPGQTAMAATTDLPDYVVIDQLAYLQHRFPAFTVPGIVALDAFSVSDLEAVSSGDGTAFTGTFTNEFGMTVSDPRVSVFPVNSAGRPLGMATSSTDMDISSGETWTFETGSVSDPGVDAVAYPAATLPENTAGN